MPSLSENIAKSFLRGLLVWLILEVPWLKSAMNSSRSLRRLRAKSRAGDHPGRPATKTY